MEGAVWRVRGDGVSMERLDGETIAINFDSGEYFSFRGPSADILWLIDAGVDESQWADILSGAFTDLQWDDTVRGQVVSFLDELATAGLIEPSPDSGGPGAPLPEDYVRGAWTAPSVHANDDLVDLLVIDPIHDTSDDGWPSTRAE